MNRTLKFLEKIILGVLFLGFSGCTEDLNSWSRGLLLGEIRAVIAGQNVSFTIDAGASAQDANGYTASLKYLSIYRRNLPPNSASLHIRVTQIDLNTLTLPFSTNQNVRLSLNTSNNAVYEGKSGDISLTISRKESDIWEGTFSGTMSNTFDPNDKISVKNGEFKVKIEHF